MRRRSLALALSLAATLPLVGLAGDETPIPGVEGVPTPLRATTRAVQAARAAQAVVAARVVAVHESPGVWCGIVVSRQDVTWEVLARVDGEATPRRIRVGHLLVHGSPLVDTTPRLHPEIVRPGREALLLLVRDDRRGWLAADEALSVRWAD